MTNQPRLKDTAACKPPFEDAAAVWHMDGDDGAAAAGVRLTVRGKVRLGVELEGAEREESLRRGGDGRAAEFDGGYLVAGEGATEALRLSGDRMTLCLRYKTLPGGPNVPLFARNAPHDPFGRILYPAPLNIPAAGYPQVKRIGKVDALEYLWRTTPLEERVHPEYINREQPEGWFKIILDSEKRNSQLKEGDFVNGVLRLQAPVDLIGADRWHDVVIRFNRARLDMFVDGVLLDRDWPHGELHRFEGPFLVGAGFQDGKLLSGFHGRIDHLALWNRALTDDEIAALSGGAESIARRDIEILGPPIPVGQYWRPRSWNVFVGDCMAFSHDGTFHVLFLSDRGHGAGKWGILGSPWGHVSTRDLVHWEEHTCPLDVTEPWECCLGTGSLAYHDGKYHLFYIKHDRRAWFKDNSIRGDAIFEAVSHDCVHFEKQTEPLFVPGFFESNDINPDIYPDATEDGYLLSLSNWKVWKSKDLQHWEERDNLTTPQWWICTSYFKWNDWYYLTSCGRYWTSRRPIEETEGWTEPPCETLRDGIRVAQVDRLGDRYLMAGFTPEPAGAAYAGELLVRELIQHPDGTLGTKWPAEMIPQSGAPLNPAFKPFAGDAAFENGAVRVGSGDGFAAALFDEMPQDVRITLRVKPGAGVESYGLCVRSRGDYTSGCELRFEPGGECVRFAPVAGDPAPEKRESWMTISGVTGLDRPFTLDVIVKDDILDACVDNRRTIVARNQSRLDGDRLFFFANRGEVVFEDIQVMPLMT